MKRVKRTMLFALCCLTVGAGMIGFVGCSTLEDEAYQVHCYENLGEPKNILIKDTSSYVQVLPSTDGNLRVECKDYEDIKHSVSVQGDTLVVKYSPKWYEYLFSGLLFKNVEPSVKIYLPDGEYQKMMVDIGSGSVEVYGDYTFATADLSVTSGRVKFTSAVTNALETEATSGEIVLSGVTCGSLDAEVTSGEVAIVDTVVARSLDLECTSGEIELSNVTCENMDAELTSGELSLVNVTAKNAAVELTSGDVNAKDWIASEKMFITVTSGTVVFDRCDALEMDVTVTSGTVRGSILSSKDWRYSVTSGDVELPQTDDGAKSRVKVTSGDVKLWLAE